MQTITQNKLTDKQYNYLWNLVPGKVVKDIRTIKKLALLGVLKLHEHTGLIVRHRIAGGHVRAWYVDEATLFEIKGVGLFREKYITGSIFPYLIRAELDDQGRIIY